MPVLKVKLAFGTLTMNNGTTGTWQNATVTLTDSGTYTWAFGTYPSGTNFSYQFMFYNSVDTVYSGINGMTVVNGNLMHINQVDSFGTTDSVITVRTQVICNGMFTARTHIAYHNQSSFCVC
jgi:hypothetical protein